MGESGHLQMNVACNDRSADGKMTTRLSYLLLFLSCAFVTIVPRVLPFVIIRSIHLPEPVDK